MTDGSRALQGDRASVRSPSAGEAALIFIPRLLTAGRAEVTEGGITRLVEPDASGVFDTGGATLVRVTDRCGNSTP